MSSTPSGYVVGIDESGRPESLVDRFGVPRPAPGDFVVVAAIAVREDLLADFERRWNRLRGQIQAELGLVELPPIHLRLMWGKALPSKDNPYHGHEDKFDRMQLWIRRAVELLSTFQSNTGGLGVYADLRPRSDMIREFGPYYTDPSFAPEVDYLVRTSKALKKNPYKAFHNLATNPVVRLLVTILWYLNDRIGTVSGTNLRVLVDRFAGATGINASEVLQASRELAGLSTISSMEPIPDYGGSPICQAADLVAYTLNRYAQERFDRRPPDLQFRKISTAVIGQLTGLQGERLHHPLPITLEATVNSICIAYALARNAAHQRAPEFADANLVLPEEFHRRAVARLGTDSTGISAITDEALKRIASDGATGHDEPKMTGPRSSRGPVGSLYGPPDDTSTVPNTEGDD